MIAVANMPDVGKKKNNPPVDPVPTLPPVEEDDGVQIALRLLTRSILRIIDAEAKHDRHSRNLMVNILLEEALKARGKWPPQS